MTTRTIVISNPDGEGNLLNPAVMSRLRVQLQDADDDAAVTGIILTGDGDTFCSGLDIPAIQAGGDPVEFAAALAELLKALPLLGTPIVAAVNGDAVASGAALVAASDYAVCVPTASVGTREVGVGIWPMVAQVPLIHRLGPRWAMENIGSGDPFTPGRAQQVGLINEVVAADELVPAAQRWLARAARGTAAARLGRPAFYRFAQLDYDEALDASVELFARMSRES